MVTISLSPKQTAWKLIIVVLGLTALTMATTAGLGYLFSSPPRSIFFWVAIGFACMAEFLVGVMAVNMYARSFCEYRPSGAIISITYSIIGAFTVSGLVAIFVYSVVRNEDGTMDAAFGGVMIAITVIWFSAALMLYAYDLRSQEGARPMLERRVAHRMQARSVAPMLSTLRGFKTNDDMLRARVSLAMKKLEAIDVALTHSHGGGSGSWEAGRQHTISPEHDQIIQDNIQALQGLVSKLITLTTAEDDSTISDFEICLAKISNSLDAIELG